MRRDEGGAAWAAGVKTRGDAALEVDERHEEALYGRAGVWKGALGELEAEKVGEGECNMAIVRRSRSFCCRSGWPAVARDACSSLRAPRIALSVEAAQSRARQRASNEQDKAPLGQIGLKERQKRAARCYISLRRTHAEMRSAKASTRGQREQQLAALAITDRGPGCAAGINQKARLRCAGRWTPSGRRAAWTEPWTQTEKRAVKNLQLLSGLAGPEGEHLIAGLGDRP